MTLWWYASIAFVACAVEAVEAATIVLAVGQGRNWGVALRGTALAVLALAAIIGLGGPALLLIVPLAIIHVAVGAFLIWYGFGWLRKAVLRYAGVIPLHDQAAIFKHRIESVQATEDRAAFTVAFNGVFVEGLEVAIIVVSVGSASVAALEVAALGAAAAALAVGAIAAALRKPFARVPENTMKFAVGIMLMTFGTFWAGEGLGLQWWHDDLSVPLLALGWLAAAGCAVALVRRSRHSAVS